MNLLGVRESGRTFAGPTYLVLFGVLVLVVVGLARTAVGNPPVAGSASWTSVFHRPVRSDRGAQIGATLADLQKEYGTAFIPPGPRRLAIPGVGQGSQRPRDMRPHRSSRA